MNLTPKKELGQNFLTDQNVIETLVDSSTPKKEDVYLEIGPGLGAVTKTLALKISKTVAVELDKDIIPKLKESVKDLGNITIINDDILNKGFVEKLISTHHINKIIGSIPYQITSPLLHELAQLSTKYNLEDTALLVQKEAGQKICVKPPKANYMSVFLQTYFEVEYIKTISKTSFAPIPKVDGAIIKLTPPQPEGLWKGASMVEPKKWSQFLHKGFKYPRKMINKAFDEKILKTAGINPTKRPGELGLLEWESIYKLQSNLL